MPGRIRNITPDDLPDVLALNESEVPHVGKVDIERLRWFLDNASYFRVARNDAVLAGFLIGLRPGLGYESPNYRWFCEHYEDFAYIDRIAIAKSARRTGLASMFYEDFAAATHDSVGRLTCEVNVEPPNDASMLFHLRLGFRQVGILQSDGGEKTVALLVKDL